MCLLKLPQYFSGTTKMSPFILEILWNSEGAPLVLLSFYSWLCSQWSFKRVLQDHMVCSGDQIRGNHTKGKCPIHCATAPDPQNYKIWGIEVLGSPCSAIDILMVLNSRVAPCSAWWTIQYQDQTRPHTCRRCA